MRALQCTADIVVFLAQPATAKANAQKIRLSLAQLAGVLKPHLISEDSLLYPGLISHHDPTVAETGKRFWEEMGGITKVVNSFFDTWRKVGAIESDPAAFISECSKIFPALKMRIEAEEAELYPLFLSQQGFAR